MIASVSFFGIALAVVLALGMPGKTNAFVKDDDTNARLILVEDRGVTIAEGIDINTEKADQDYERERTYDQDRMYDQDQDHDVAHDQRRHHNLNGQGSGTPPWDSGANKH